MADFIELPSSKGAGGWFRAADHKGDLAILIEVKALEEDHFTPNGLKDRIIADVTTFATEADLAKKEPTTIQQGVRIEQRKTKAGAYGLLVRDLIPAIGNATIATLDQLPPVAGNRPAWVWRTPSADVKKQVIAYYDERETAIAAALESAPSFE